MATWANTTIATIADLVKIESEIANLTTTGDSTYFGTDIDIATATPLFTSVDVSDGKGITEIICVTTDSLGIASGKTLSFTTQDSADDVTFADISTGNLNYYKKGAPTIVVSGTELFRYVVPTTAEDFLNFTCSSDATNSGTVSIYAVAKWNDKYDVAKDLLKSITELRLIADGKDKYIDYPNGDILIDVIYNPEIFKYTMLFLWASIIYEDLSNSETDSYGIKQQLYKEKADREFEREYSLKYIDENQDGTVDEYKVRSSPKTMVSL
jgi:hypothetical protein